MYDLPLTCQSLLDRLAGKSGDAWQEFLRIYGGAVYDYCRNRGLQDADADDVCQEVLVAVEKHLKAGRHDPAKGKFRGWMFRVARNIAIDYVQAKSKQVAGSGDTKVAQVLAEIPEAAEAQSGAFQLEYRRHLFHWAVAQVKPCVSESTWLSFWRTAIEGQSSDQVAGDLQMKTGAVYTAKCRVIARLRDVISELAGLHGEHEEFFDNDIEDET